MNQTDDDLSADFQTIAQKLNHPSGLTYRNFKKNLKPAYTKVWLDIGLGYLALLITSGVILFLPHFHWMTSVSTVVIGSMALGYIHQYISLFMHEAAHFNLAANHALNDRLTNIFMGVLHGYSIQAYRPKHFDHHRTLGLPEDPEHHYFHSLNWRFVLLILSGTRTVMEIFHRLFGPKPTAQSTNLASGKSGRWVMITGGLLHVTIVGTAIWFGQWAFSLAWILGFLIWFPFFSMLRQILEHRDFDAADNTDFTKQSHGAITRLFGDGAVANTLGGAGFNRHLLHHWEPQVSYTRLKELEQFLLETEVGPIIRSRQETYFASFRKLLR